MPVLNQEERQQIDHEERIRLRAQVKYRSKRRSSVIGWTLGSIGFFTLIIVLADWYGDAQLNTVSASVKADMRTQISAYHIASRDFARKMIHGEGFAGNSFGGRAPGVASFSPDKVKLLSPGLYAISLVFEGHDVSGKPEPKVATYSVRCSEGLCMVIEGPK